MPQREVSFSASAVPAHEAPSPQTSSESRLAKASDILEAQNISKGAKRYWINHLCKYRNTSNLAWPKIATAMADLVTSERSIQNYRRELLDAGWICLPEGDAGGRPRDGERGGTVIHLHPNGKPCHLPRIVLKQRTAQASTTEQGQGPDLPTNHEKGAKAAPFVNPVSSQKGAELAPLRVQKTTETGAENDGAIRKELLIEPLKEEPSTSSSARPAASSVTSDASGVVVEVPGYDPKSRAERIFIDLQQMCFPALDIDGFGRARILKAAHENGFSLEQLRYAWRRNPMSEAGGVIKLAEDWRLRISHITDWPSCYECEDTGVVVLQQKLGRPRRDSEAAYGHPCSCSRGAELRNGFQEALQRQMEGAATVAIHNDQRRAAAAERQRLAKEAAEKEAQAAASYRARLEAEHICPKCEGAGGRQQHQAWHLCLMCLGTGAYWTPEEHGIRNECRPCHGTGKLHDTNQQYGPTCKKPPRMKACPRCGGSGKFA